MLFNHDESSLRTHIPQLASILSRIDCNIAYLVKELRVTQSEYGNCLKDFKIIEELGRGSYGIAYKVEALKHTDLICVLKKIHIKHIQPKQQREALREVLILRKLSHPYIIRYYTSFIEEDCLYILMEYAAGGDLYKVFVCTILLAH